MNIDVYFTFITNPFIYIYIYIYIYIVEARGDVGESRTASDSSAAEGGRGPYRDGCSGTHRGRGTQGLLGDFDGIIEFNLLY